LVALYNAAYSEELTNPVTKNTAQNAPKHAISSKKSFTNILGEWASLTTKPSGSAPKFQTDFRHWSRGPSYSWAALEHCCRDG